MNELAKSEAKPPSGRIWICDPVRRKPTPKEVHRVTIEVTRVATGAKPARPVPTELNIQKKVNKRLGASINNGYVRCHAQNFVLKSPLAAAKSIKTPTELIPAVAAAAAKSPSVALYLSAEERSKNEHQDVKPSHFINTPSSFIKPTPGAKLPPTETAKKPSVELPANPAQEQGVSVSPENGNELKVAALENATEEAAGKMTEASIKEAYFRDKFAIARAKNEASCRFSLYRRASDFLKKRARKGVLERIIEECSEKHGVDPKRISKRTVAGRVYKKGNLDVDALSTRGPRPQSGPSMEAGQLVNAPQFSSAEPSEWNEDVACKIIAKEEGRDPRETYKGKGEESEQEKLALAAAKNEASSRFAAYKKSTNSSKSKYGTLKRIIKECAAKHGVDPEKIRERTIAGRIYKKGILNVDPLETQTCGTQSQSKVSIENCDENEMAELDQPISKLKSLDELSLELFPIELSTSEKPQSTANDMTRQADDPAVSSSGSVRSRRKTASSRPSYSLYSFSRDQRRRILSSVHRDIERCREKYPGKTIRDCVSYVLNFHTKQYPWITVGAYNSYARRHVPKKTFREGLEATNVPAENTENAPMEEFEASTNVEQV